MDKFRACLCFISLIRTTRRDDNSLMKLSSFPLTVFCVFGSIFYLGVMLDTKLGAHDPKMSLQKFPRITKKG